MNQEFVPKKMQLGQMSRRRIVLKSFSAAVCGGTVKKTDSKQRACVVEWCSYIHNKAEFPPVALQGARLICSHVCLGC